MSHSDRVTQKQQKDEDAGLQYLFGSGARLSGSSYFCADLTLKVNSCETV